MKDLSWPDGGFVVRWCEAGNLRSVYHSSIGLSSGRYMASGEERFLSAQAPFGMTCGGGAAGARTAGGGEKQIPHFVRDDNPRNAFHRQAAGCTGGEGVLFRFW